MRLYTHLNFGGNCEEAFRFYQKHLGGTITMMMTSRDLPPQVKAPPGPAGFVIHARLDVAGVTLIGNDVPEAYFKPIRSSYVYLAVDSAQDAERIYAVLAEGGEVTMPLEQTFFASRFAQLRDRYGTLWTVIHETPGREPDRRAVAGAAPAGAGAGPQARG